MRSILPEDVCERRTAVCLLLFGAAWLVLRLFLIGDRVFDGDELEHLHGAWLVSRGQVPFRDFFEHHGPLFPFLLAPATALFDDPVRAILAARLFMLAITAAAIKCLWDMTPPGPGYWRRALPAVLLCSFTTFADKSLEVRPDVPAMALLCFALLLASGDPAALKSRLAAGLSLGLAFFFTPKAAYPAAGLAAGWLISDIASGASVKDLLRRWAFFLLGASVPPALVLLYYYVKDGFRAFYACFYLFNSRFRLTFPFTVFWLPSYLQNTAVWTLGLAGAAVFRRDAAKACALAAGAAGALSLPVVYPQYYLLLAPPLCFFAAGAFFRLTDKFESRAARVSLAAGLCVLLVPSFLRQAGSLKDDNASQREGIECVMSRTAPEDRVFDAWTGESFYRPHAYYFWFLHDEVRAMVDAEVLEKGIRLALSDERCRGLISGAYFRSLPAGVLEQARRDFTYSGCGRLFLRKTPPPARARQK